VREHGQAMTEKQHAVLNFNTSQIKLHLGVKKSETAQATIETNNSKKKDDLPFY
jgi:hypothetical protein